MFHYLNNALGDRKDNASVENDALDEDFVLLEEFPCTEWSKNNSVFSRFNFKISLLEM